MTALAAEIVATGGPRVRDLTGPICARDFWLSRRPKWRFQTIPA